MMPLYCFLEDGYLWHLGFDRSTQSITEEHLSSRKWPDLLLTENSFGRSKVYITVAIPNFQAGLLFDLKVLTYVSPNALSFSFQQYRYVVDNNN